jgi:hypothetical protein
MALHLDEIRCMSHDDQLFAGRASRGPPAAEADGPVAAESYRGTAGVEQPIDTGRGAGAYDADDRQRSPAGRREQRHPHGRRRPGLHNGV